MDIDAAIRALRAQAADRRSPLPTKIILTDRADLPSALHLLKEKAGKSPCRPPVLRSL